MVPASDLSPAGPHPFCNGAQVINFLSQLVTWVSHKQVLLIVTSQEGPCTGTRAPAERGGERPRHTQHPAAYLLHPQEAALAAPVNQPHRGTSTHDFHSVSDCLGNRVLQSGSPSAKVSGQGLGGRAPVSSSQCFFRHPGHCFPVCTSERNTAFSSKLPQSH